MQTGTKISALAHGLLLAWAFLGGVFRSEPLPVEVQDVTVISAEEFDRMTGQSDAPEAVAALAEPEQPEESPAPEVAAEPDTPPAQAQPEPAPEPAAEPLPETVPEPAPPAPEAPPEPEPTPTPPDADTAAVVPEPPQRPSDRIAPEPVAPPPPEAQPDPVEREEVVADDAADTAAEEQQATAPEEAATEIVTEAEETAALAPTRSPRPAVRPNRPARPATPASEPAQPQAAETEDAVAAALAEAMSGAQDTVPAAPAAPSGPPLSAGEKEALRVAVSSCWNVGSLSSEALATTVVVAVSLTQDGKPQVDTIRMVSHSGGGAGAAKQAFEAARRAIIRCGTRGYDLPAAKYDRWRNIEMTFNPERMRIK